MSSGHRQQAGPVNEPRRSIVPAAVLGWFDRVIPRTGVQLLSQQWLRLLVLLAMLAVLVINAATMPTLYDAVVPIALVISVLQAASLPWALTRPRFAVGVCVAAVAGTTILTAPGHGRPWPVPVITLVALALMVFILAVRQPWPVPIAGAVLPVVAAALCSLPFDADTPGSVVTNLVTAASILALVVTFGILIHQWLLSRAELLEQVEIAAMEQERRHVIEERTRIARELHDVVAHGLSVISIQASTVQYRIADVPPGVVAELDEITDSARRALVEMRGLLAVLRQEDGDNELAPQPTMISIPALVESTRRGTETVRLHVTGELDDPQVPESVSLTVYRLIQEALSNALRHAAGSEIDVRLSIAEDHVVVDVENSRSSERVTPSEGEGFGLRGMRERASFVGGTLIAEPTAAGGFLVHAVLPCRQHEEPVGRVSADPSP
jgi:signal transduction histidine kinase